MKKSFLFIALFLSFISFSQDVKRQTVNGKIIVEGSDLDGITIFNSASKKGSVTDVKGEFKIDVALNDIIEVRSLEYQNFNFKVNKIILESKRMSILLIEEINMLDEVVITNKNLTGNLKVDVNKVQKFIPKLNTIYFGRKSSQTTNLPANNDIKNKNLLVHSQAKTMVNGLNIINVVDQLLIPLFRSEVKDKKASGVPDVPSKSVKYYLGSNFLVENFNIPEHRVEEFIRYVEDDTFDFEMLNYGHEIEFLQLLSEKSETFLAKKIKSN